MVASYFVPLRPLNEGNNIEHYCVASVHNWLVYFVHHTVVILVVYSVDQPT